MFDTEKYQESKKLIKVALDTGRNPLDLMAKYKRCVIAENYEMCKAITEALEPLNYFTADTHSHIAVLQDQ
jgi:hypothetical protein